MVRYDGIDTPSSYFPNIASLSVKSKKWLSVSLFQASVSFSERIATLPYHPASSPGTGRPRPG